MSLDNVIAQFIGFLEGLIFVVFVVIYMKLRERMAKLEWSVFRSDKSKQPMDEPKEKKAKEV